MYWNGNKAWKDDATDEFDESLVESRKTDGDAIRRSRPNDYWKAVAIENAIRTILKIWRYCLWWRTDISHRWTTILTVCLKRLRFWMNKLQIMFQNVRAHCRYMKFCSISNLGIQCGYSIVFEHLKWNATIVSYIKELQCGWCYTARNG